MNDSYNLTGTVMTDDDDIKTPRSSISSKSHADFLRKLYQGIKEEISIEPMMFLHMVAFSSISVIVQNLYIDRICRITHGYSEEICSNLTARNGTEEKEIEATAADFKMYQSIIEALFPVLFALFLGPWTDLHGIRLPILLTFCGYTASSLMYLVLSLFPDVPPSYLLLCSVPISLTGGLVALLLSAFTFISNRSTVPNRSFRIAVLEGCWFLGTPFGFLGGAWIYKQAGFIPVFLLSAAFFGAALLYGLVFIKEPAAKSVQGMPTRKIITDMFNVRSVKDTVMTVFKKRPGPRRHWLMLLMVTIFMRMLALFGTMQVAYLYTRNKFSWDVSSFSAFTTADTLICLSGGLITLIAMKAFKISDAVIGIFSAVGFTLANFIFAVANQGWLMYFAAVVQMFAGLITIVMRSMISKCVSKDELGKAFSFVSIGEACLPILAGLLFNLLYKQTLTTFPGSVFLLASGLHAAILCSFIYFYISMQRYPFQLLLDEQAIENNAL